MRWRRVIVIEGAVEDLKDMRSVLPAGTTVAYDHILGEREFAEAGTDFSRWGE